MRIVSPQLNTGAADALIEVDVPDRSRAGGDDEREVGGSRPEA